MDSGSSFTYIFKNTNNSTLLATGDVVQFGYYTGATLTNLFAGTWIPLTGDGGANSGFTFTVIGQDASQGWTNGTFGYSLGFTQGSGTTGVSLPSAGQIMGIRFYNGTTVASSTYYGAFSSTNSAWLWVAPSSSSAMAISADDPGVTWLNNKVAYTGTAIAVPEPGAVMLFVVGMGSCLLLVRYRRKTL